MTRQVPVDIYDCTDCPYSKIKEDRYYCELLDKKSEVYFDNWANVFDELSSWFKNDCPLPKGE